MKSVTGVEALGVAIGAAGNCDWTAAETVDGWQVQWRGRPFGSPRPSRQAADEAIVRYARRYAGDSAGVLLSVAARKRTRRSGLWRWRRMNGDSGAFFAGSRKAARVTLLRMLNRQRLPSDLVLEPPL